MFSNNIFKTGKLLTATLLLTFTLLGIAGGYALAGLESKKPITTIASNSNPNLVDIVSTNSSLSTLKTALTATGLVDTVQKGTFTVLAPNNVAFAKIPSQTLNDLLKPEKKSDLEKILQYHVIAGKFDAQTIKKQTSITTVLGQTISVKVQGEKIILNNMVEVIATDIVASNGVAHIIDSVLIPSPTNTNAPVVGNSSSSSSSSSSPVTSSSLLTVSSSSVATSNSAPAPIQTNSNNSQPAPKLSVAIASTPSLSTLKELITIAGINPDSLTTSTVFAPTNDAFAKLPASLVNYLKHNPEVLKQIILNHIVGQELTLQNVMQFLNNSDAPIINSVNTQLSLSTQNNQIFVNSSKVVQTDIKTTSGIVHLVDRVIL